MHACGRADEWLKSGYACVFCRMEEPIPIIIQYVESRQTTGGSALFVAHNGRRFDFRFLLREFIRCSMQIPHDWLFVDTLRLAHELISKG